MDGERVAWEGALNVTSHGLCSPSADAEDEADTCGGVNVEYMGLASEELEGEACSDSSSDDESAVAEVGGSLKDGMMRTVPSEGC